MRNRTRELKFSSAMRADSTGFSIKTMLSIARKQHKIFQTIVCLISIYMMNMFRRLQYTANPFFHNKTMFTNISVRYFSSSFPTWMFWPGIFSLFSKTHFSDRFFRTYMTNRMMRNARFSQSLIISKLNLTQFFFRFWSMMFSFKSSGPSRSIIFQTGPFHFFLNLFSSFISTWHSYILPCQDFNFNRRFYHESAHT